MTDREQKLLSFAQKKGQITKLEADQLLGENAIDLLRRLTEQGLLEQKQLKMF